MRKIQYIKKGDILIDVLDHSRKDYFYKFIEYSSCISINCGLKCCSICKGRYKLENLITNRIVFRCWDYGDSKDVFEKMEEFITEKEMRIE